MGPSFWAESIAHACYHSKVGDPVGLLLNNKQQFQYDPSTTFQPNQRTTITTQYKTVIELPPPTTFQVRSTKCNPNMIEDYSRTRIIQQQFEYNTQPQSKYKD
jgi:hypothetical protein